MKQTTQTKEVNSYEQQAIDFANKYGVKLQILGSTHGIMPNWKDDTYRYIFSCRLTRNGKSYSFKFGQSINDGSNEPTIYDVLACMTKNDPESFENFCDEFGYDTDSRTAERTYKAVVKEWNAMERLFGDVMEELQEIN